MADKEKEETGAEVLEDTLTAEQWAAGAVAFDSKWEIVKNALEPGKSYTRGEVAELVKKFLITPAN